MFKIYYFLIIGKKQHSIRRLFVFDSTVRLQRRSNSFIQLDCGQVTDPGQYPANHSQRPICITSLLPTEWCKWVESCSWCKRAFHSNNWRIPCSGARNEHRVHWNSRCSPFIRFTCGRATPFAFSYDWISFFCGFPWHRSQHFKRQGVCAGESFRVSFTSTFNNGSFRFSSFASYVSVCQWHSTTSIGCLHWHWLFAVDANRSHPIRDVRITRQCRRSRSFTSSFTWASK